MSIIFSNIAKTFLLEAVSASEDQFIIDPGEYGKFLESSGDYSYAQLIDASGNSEIVKIDIADSSAHIDVEASYSGGLSVSRGQGGSSARAWPRGSLIYQEVTKSFLNDAMQKAGHRSVAYNPNGVLSPNYFGEKVYRSDVAGWWKSFNATDPVWFLIAGSAGNDVLVYPGDAGWTWDIPEGWGNWPVYAAASFLYSWGWNSYGQLGQGDITDRLTPVQVGSGANWAGVSGGGEYSIGIKTDGTLWSWGLDDGDGVLGQGDPPLTALSTPVQIGSDSTWAYITAASTSTYVHAIKTNGTLWSWGSSNTVSGIIIPGAPRLSTPVQVGSDTTWNIVSTSGGFSTALKTNGTMWSWGYNIVYGLLGRGDSGDGTDSSTPVQVGSGTDWSIVSGGTNHAMAIDANGKLYSWGRDEDGELGHGDHTHKSTPVQVGSDSDWKDVKAGATSTIALKTNGTLWTWGEGADGQLGDGTVVKKSTPVQVGSATYLSIGRQLYTHFAIKTDGTLWAWGFCDEAGELGTGDTASVSTPVQVGSDTDWSFVADSGYHGFGIR